MNWGTGNTYTTFTMGSATSRAHAVADLESIGYACSVDDSDGTLLVDVDHDLEHAAMVRCLVLRRDPNATMLRH